MGRYAFLPHLSAFGGAGIAGRIRYPVEPDGDTKPTVDFGGEIFGGIQL